MAVGHISLSRVNWVLDNIINTKGYKCYFVTKGHNEFEIRRNVTTLVKSFVNEEELDQFLEDLQRKKLEVKHAKNSHGIMVPTFVKSKQEATVARHKQTTSESIELFDSDDNVDSSSDAYFD